ncbi:hypothetical protein F3Y22_tig00111402pilonHSYRG00786 [Hibiscus syriacus]|uniref:RRM domain-containing protein n=1 Tax=Hibiscus syriacus TaxID=106335 RepID=A0A6A2Y4U6_HIBSY|nr:hypothetical protein F3Y22_tig00111402pilonHSYRG00786 [Hibiscus syriacus]
MIDSTATQVVSLFMENIPKAFHWKGLWFLFARYGNVVGEFIANKLSRKGKRFGFVRFGSKVEAERCMEKLNGFVLNDCKLSVQFEKSRESSRMGGSRDADRVIRPWGGCFQVETSKEASLRNLNQEKDQFGNFQAKNKEVGRLIRNEVSSIKRIKGFVEKEVLLKLKKCLVDRMSTVYSVREISFRLQKWGLESIKVELWSESLVYSERATWIKVSGVPLHCWNHITLKRVAELWENFESLGENADQSIDCENVTILITTNLDKRIDEIVAIEIGNIIHLVRVLEIGISDDIGTRLNGDNSGASSTKFERIEEVRVAELTACCFGNEFIRNDDTQLHENSRHLNESELSGGGNILAVHDPSRNDGLFGVEGSAGKVIASLEEHVDINRDTGKNVESSALNNGDAGFHMGSDFDSPATNVDYNQLRRTLKDFKGRGYFMTDDLVNSFPKIEHLRKNKKLKKYGCLLKIQNQVLSVPNRRKRDQALKKLKLKIDDLDSSELSGRSLSDSDLKCRWLAAFKEGEKTLELGKSLGIHFSGEKQEVVKEVALLVMN